MDTGDYLRWIVAARVEERAEAARSVAEAFLVPDLDADERATVEAALTLILEDRSPVVRRALAEALSVRRGIPEGILHHLALDQYSVSAPILARSSLCDRVLMDALKRGDERIGKTIADRPDLGADVCRAIAQSGGFESCLVLVTNPHAQVGRDMLQRIIERFGHHPDMRGALLVDRRLDAKLRQRLVDVSNHAVCSSPLVRALLGEARADELEVELGEETPMIVVEASDTSELGLLIADLRDAGRLTSALCLKALIVGQVDFVAAVAAQTSARDGEHVRSIIVRGSDNALRALLRDAGMRGSMLDVGVEAIRIWRDVAANHRSMSAEDVAWTLFNSARAAEAASDNDDLSSYIQRIHADLVRARQRARAADLVATAKAAHNRHVDAVFVDGRIDDMFVDAFDDIDEALSLEFDALDVTAVAGQAPANRASDPVEVYDDDEMETALAIVRSMTQHHAAATHRAPAPATSGKRAEAAGHDDYDLDPGLIDLLARIDAQDRIVQDRQAA